MDPESMAAEIASLKANQQQLWDEVVDHRKRFDTLQTPLWKRAWFRIDGWPGQCNLNADKRAWRPWRRDR
jgi:hypothetical protein